MAQGTRYPVVVEADPDPTAGRWLWLVKWLLAIPHYVVLVFLWIAFLALTVAAFFAILFTGRYPAGMFRFNTGVLRWSWRVGFYAYRVLGTDRYPPFTLSGDVDYPARLTIREPGRMSRGLVLVKWWLLALPQYLVVALFVRGGVTVVAEGPETRSAETWEAMYQSPGLIGLLVLFAAVALLFTGAYPRGLFDLVVGLNRWVLRVVAYAALMTDRYPPFRLDTGGPERDETRGSVTGDGPT
ncbi:MULTISPECIES: DUF4389 domain-containing protein [Nocardiopsis]|uniref:DUF4389 domain-containing protein n=1 Tax=Nocardiopsis TaxID=2013 RepID=UPI0008FC6247|nr:MULTISPECIES: DUF4389 domain-containing protein [Nocardiopsis]APC34861.1 hypothetical protein A9R04_09215 [Nocardiopsis dassonvillei]